MARQVKVEILGDARGLQRGFRDAERHTVRFSASLARFSGVAVRAFGGVGVAAAGLGTAAAAMGVKTIAANEQAAIAFKHLTGSAEQGRKTLQQLQSFAARTPFEFPGVAEAAQQLLGAGQKARDLIPTLTAIGDAASTATNPADTFQRTVLALSQAMTKGKLQGDDLQQVTEAGIPIWRELAKATGEPVAKLQDLSSKGKLLTDSTLPKLFAQLHKDYGGAMAEQSQTLTGLWSTLMDTLSQGLAGVIKPFEGELKKGMTGAISIAQGALKGVADFINGTLIPALQTARTWWTNNKDEIGKLAKAFGETFTPAAEGAKKKTDDLSTSAERLGKKFTGAAIFAAELVKWWIETRIQTTELMKATYNLITGLGLAANVIDKLTFGTGHAADAVVAFGREGKRVAESDLAKLRSSAKTTQDVIDRMHGKDLAITAHTSVEVAKSVRQYLAAANVPGFRASGGMVRLGETVIVGEQGPELVKFTKPGWVYPAEQTREILGRGMAGGGPIGAPLRDRFYDPTVRQTGRIGQSMADVAAAVLGHLGARPPHVPGGWKVALDYLRGLGILFDVISTFRPGARTHATGAVSYHALNRAVDLNGPNKLAIFNALAGTDPTELIYSRASRYKSRRGWRPIGVLDPITRADHYSHVHAAYDRGGWLPPGATLAVNRTGRGEPIGFDYRELAEAIVDALHTRPPQVVLDGHRVDRALGSARIGNARLA